MPKFERSMDIDANVEKVWEVITKVDLWPHWFPGIDSVTNVSSVEAGGTFEWTGGGKTGTGVIGKVVPMKHLEVLTQMGDDKDSHVFELQPAGGFMGLGTNECKVDYTLDTLMGGGILGNLVAAGNPMDTLRVSKALTMLRKFVESM